MLFGVVAAHFVDGLGIVHAGGLAGEFAAGFGVEALDGFFDAGDGVGDDAEFVDAEADEKGGQVDFGGHFAADADPQSVVVGGFGGHGDEAEDGGMGGLVKVGDAFVAAAMRAAAGSSIIQPTSRSCP